ncbi:MAG TPA: AMP-binding protein [Candidatus Binatia bacterium]
MQLEEFLEATARVASAKIALVCGDRRLTYGEIEGQCNRLAHVLAAAGIERGDRVMIYLENSVEAVLAVFATLKAGAVFVMVNPTTKAERFSYIMNHCRAAAVVTDGAKFDSIRGALDGSSIKAVLLAGAERETQNGRRVLSLGEILADETISCEAPPKRCIDIDLATLVYTSGSTGRPKGVMITHLNAVTAAHSIISYLENTADDVVVNVLPLAFGYGLYQVFMMFRVGGTVVLERSFTYPAAVLDRVVREQATGFPMIPTIAAMLLQLDLTKWDFSHLRYITNAGAAIPLEHIARLRKLMPHVKIYSMYGQTECTRVTYLPPDQIDTRPGSVGRGIPNQEHYVVGESGERVGPGVVGELVVRGSHVMKGYWEMPEETHRALRPGLLPGERVLHTGDLFKTDEEGYLYFVARKDDIIKTRGEKVSPREVEDALYALPGVAHAAVIGVPDEILGSAVKAVIVPRAGMQLTEREVLRHCAAHLDDYMVPKFVEFRDAMPTTASGKVAKLVLSEQARQAL